MSLAPGSRLGPYEVTSLLGAGGMGEVYRGRDTKLNRDVAIKVLPDTFAGDHDRLSRFTREAQVLASLNHPNIAHVYGIEDRALVMELVEGEDLSEIIAADGARGLQIPEALAIAKQIADALEAAHEHGIIHRDLKPANIKVREDGVVKVLDFGLAKAIDPAGTTGASVANSPTITARATQIGMILGTAAYMSPEQAKGKAVDKRADIWAFGAVLYEMLTGRRAFKGDDVTETLASVLKDNADFTALPPSVPPRLRALIARCLERDVKLRLRDIGEARVELGKITDHPELPATPSAPVAAPPPSRLPWVVAAVAAAVAAIAGWSALGARPAPVAAAPIHARLNLDPAEALLGSEPAEIRIGSRRPSRTPIAISSDGRWLAFTGVQKGTQQLFLRDLGRDAAVAVAGTTGADNPFFSPDDKWIGFWSSGALRKVPVDGGPVSEICKTPRIAGADWARDGRILFGTEGAISVVPADGGASSIVAKLDAASDDEALRLPRWIDSNQFLYVVLNSRAEIRSRLVAQRFDGTGKRVLMEDATDGRLVAGGSHLVFMRQATLMAAPFDLGTASVKGAAQGMVDGVLVSLNAPNTAIDAGAGAFTVSESGTLVYLPGNMFEDTEAVFTWLDRQGHLSPVEEMDRRSYSAPRLSPDNLRAVTFTIGNERGIWIHDFQRRSTRKVSFDGLTGRVMWTPDGKSIVFGGQTARDRGLYRMPADGSGTAEHLPGGIRNPTPAGWSRDGSELVYIETVREADGGNGTSDIFAVALATGKSRPLVHSNATETHAAVSPDGRWLAYVSNETSRNEVLVQPYDGGGRVDISVGGGTAPRWAPDGKTLIYSKQIPDPNNRDRVRFEMWEVPLTIGATLTAGTPRKFADLAQEDFGTATPTANYDVALDGRILGTTRHLVTPTPPAILNVITNWFDELRSKVGGPGL